MLDRSPSTSGAGGASGTAGTAGADFRFVSRLAEPGRFWIAYAPRAWAWPERPCLDLAAGRLVRQGRPAAPLPGAGRCDDLVYLPAVAAARAAERDALAVRLLASGAPVLVQLLPGDAVPAPPGALVAVDLLPALLAGDLGACAAVPPGAAAIFPLLPGMSDRPDLWTEACRRLAGAGVRCAQAVVPELQPGDRRWLAEGRGEAVFEALFHHGAGAAPVERDFARVAHGFGLAPFLARPLPRAPLTRGENRRVAGLLALAGELWLRLGRPVEPAQSLFRAARFWDASPYDVAALTRDGNLGVVPTLDPLAREVVAAAADGGEPPLLSELLAEYLRDAAAQSGRPEE